MKLATTDDVENFMSAYVASAALGAALELGLFWQLAEQPQDSAGAARAMGIPANRCRHWLDLLSSMGLLEQVSKAYTPSSVARTAILEAYSRDTWAFLALEARERFPTVHDLALHIHRPDSTWALQGLTPPDYIAQMEENPERARRFTRMLYELHQPLAKELAQFLDMTGVERLMDLGGGSGVVSLALLREHPHLTAVVVDIANVCVAGREVAVENSMEGRIEYYAADFLQDELPSRFDVVLECDVGIYGEALFRKLRAVLHPGGRLVIVDPWAQAEDPAQSSRLAHAFRASLHDPDFAFPTAAQIQAELTQAGFQLLSEQVLSSGELVIEARK